MKLFATAYLDEDVSVLVQTLLRARGFDVVTARSENMLGRDDAAQLAHATSLERCLVTHNRVHFESLHKRCLESTGEHCGIIIVTRHSPYEIARRLAILLNSLPADEIKNQLLYG